MPLKVIGAGFGRTGTMSLKLALEALGFGPCHHMREVIDHPEQIPFWRRAAAGEPVDWEEVYKGYAATVDWPGAYFWRALADRYPQAKVILTHRPDADWLASVHATIWPVMSGRHELPQGDFRDAMALSVKVVNELTFDEAFDDEAHALHVYHDHIARVRETIAPARLLFFDVAEGWAPLCGFLGVAAPDEPFPRANSRDEFLARMTERRAAAGTGGA